MADPRFVVPYRDPYDTPLSPSFFNLTNPTLADLSINTDNNNVPTLADLSNNNNNILAAVPQQIHHGLGNGVQQVNHNLPLPDPMVQDQFMQMGNYFPNVGGGNFEAGPSQLHGVPNHQSPNGYFGLQNYNNEVLPLSYWPQLPAPFSCSCCQVLREIIHTNGITFTKLEIHGRLGMICHAIHHPNINGSLNSASSSNLIQYQMIDFCMRNIQEIKNFLVQYCLGQNSLGFVMMQDPLSAFYEALCTGMDWADDLSDFVDLNPNASGGTFGDDIEQEAEIARVPRATLAEQRERAAKMKLSDLSDYFHLTIDETSKLVNLCPTVVKKVCRKEGLARWPHRKVKSIVKQITVLRRNLNSADAVSRSRAEAEISRLEREMIKHCGGVAPTAISFE